MLENWWLMHSTKSILSRNFLLIQSTWCIIKLETVVLIPNMENETKIIEKIINRVLKIYHWTLSRTSPKSNRFLVSTQPWLLCNKKITKKDTIILQPSLPHRQINFMEEQATYSFYNLCATRKLKCLLLGLKTELLIVLPFRKFYFFICCLVMSIYLLINIHKPVSGNMSTPEKQFMWHKRHFFPTNIQGYKYIVCRNCLSIYSLRII